jgi:hypothetical protein
MTEVILLLILTIPLYRVLIWTYSNPKESIYWEKQWMYEEEEEISEGVIRYTKVTSMTSMVIMTTIIALIIISYFF